MHAHADVSCCFVCFFVFRGAIPHWRCLVYNDASRNSVCSLPWLPPTDPSDKKYRALMDNVSLHLQHQSHHQHQVQQESATKERRDSEPNTTNTTSNGGSGNGSGSGNVALTASKLPVRNAKGGALKKLNKRYAYVFACIQKRATVLCL